jgi:hypothetical protein
VRVARSMPPATSLFSYSSPSSRRAGAIIQVGRSRQIDAKSGAGATRSGAEECRRSSMLENCQRFVEAETSR